MMDDKNIQINVSKANDIEAIKADENMISQVLHSILRYTVEIAVPSSTINFRLSVKNKL